MKSKISLPVIVLILSVVVLSITWIIIKPINKGLDLVGGVYLVLEAKEENGEVTEDTMDKLYEIIQKRVNSIGISEASIQKNGTNRLIVEMPGLKNVDDAVELIGTTAKLEFKIKNEDGTYGEALLDGGDLSKAGYSEDSLKRPAVAFQFTPESAATFEKITRENVNKQLAILLDDKEISAPNINGAIAGGSGIIEGRFTRTEVNDLVNLLNAGALPVNIEILEKRTVDASLGSESISKTLNAGLIAVALVAGFMLLVYRLPGIFADIALIIFGILTFGLLSFVGATLTLPGIAGIILSLGMAVDANVIIFERIKEELARGRSVIDSIDEGFDKALSSIIDSNITTLIITLVLFIFGTGPVRGFSVTLTLGILASMFTAILVTKVLLQLFVNVFNITNKKYFGIKEGK